MYILRIERMDGICKVVVPVHQFLSVPVEHLSGMRVREQLTWTRLQN